MPTYDIVISFAGEDRAIAEKLASALTLIGLTVFYDEYAQAELWGKDLYTHLTRVYRDEGKFCLMLVSGNYAAKQWTTHERRAAQARAFTEHREYILPLRLDDTHIDGLLDTTGYLDFHTTGLERVVALLRDKVNTYNQEHGITAHIVTAEDVFRRQGIGPNGGPPFSDADMITECPTCHTRQSLAEAPVTLDHDDTVYSCKHGCQPIAVVSRPGLVAWPGRGYRLGAHVIRNAADIMIKTPQMGAAMLIPASQAALMRARP